MEVWQNIPHFSKYQVSSYGNIKNIINNKIIQDMKVNMEKSLGDMGRILIRPSGTEDMIRIMVESTNQKKVNEITDKLENLIVEQDRFEKNK